MLGSYEALLPELISRAAAYGMQLFRASLAGAGLKKNTPIVIIGGDLIDPAGGQTLRNAEILIEHGVIIKTGRSGDFPIPDRARVIHADGNTILPGLWDMHTHFEQAEWGPAYLAAGVTTVRDCGNEFGYINSIKQAIDRGEGIGPNILKAGIIDGAGPYALGIVRATTKEEAIAQVKRYKDNGFVQIKIYSSVKPAIVKAICEEAHALDLTVTGHIPDGMTLLQGIDSGMDMVNHIDYVYRAMKRNRDLSIDLHDSLSVRVLNQLKSHHTVIDPTLSVYELIVRSVKDDITLIEPSFYSLPVPLQALFKNMGMPPDIAARYKILMTSREEIVKALYDYGITVVAGTDGCIPGYSLDRELELYVEAGMKPIDAIRSATIIPARVMHKEKEYGSLQPGMKADLIILNGDPTLDIRKLRLVKMVIKDGELFDPTSLHRMVGFSN
jgi:imidazolonepropionase-like amidohydrolase